MSQMILISLILLLQVLIKSICYTFAGPTDQVVHTSFLK